MLYFLGLYVAVLKTVGWRRVARDRDEGLEEGCTGLLQNETRTEGEKNVLADLEVVGAWRVVREERLREEREERERVGRARARTTPTQSEDERL